MDFLDSSKTYLVAVSGGADSMALLDMLRIRKFHLLVAHVNYKSRPTSDRDESIVVKYCEKYNIPVYIDYPTQNKKGNFEEWARDARYSFFKKLYDLCNVDVLLVAHHRDDVIETYLMKKKRKCVGYDLTIPKKSYAFEMNIYRPCYELSKTKLREYCEVNKIEFGDDETNFVPIYARNKIRLNELSNLEEEKKNEMFLNIIKENDEWNNNLSILLKPFKDKQSLNFSKLISQNLDSQVLILYDYIATSIKDKNLNKKLSYRRIVDMLEKLNNKANISIPLTKELSLVKEYENLWIKSEDFEKYSYSLEKFSMLKTPYFEISLEGAKMEGIYVKEEDYPLTIRTYTSDDFIKIKDGHKSVRRLFIDKKVPVEVRNKMPILLNCKQEILLIPSLYKEVERKSLQSNFIMIKYHKY